MSTTTTKTAQKSPKVRVAPAIGFDAPDFSAKVKTALLASVAKGVGQVRVKVADKDDRAGVRKLQKRIQGIGYSAGFNANFRVTLAGDVLTGQVQDLTVTDAKPGHTDPTAKTPGTRSTFHGWTPDQISAWKTANPVKTVKGEKVAPKSTKTARKTGATKTVRKVTKTAPKVAQTAPKVLSGVTGKVDTKTVTVTKTAPKTEAK